METLEAVAGAQVRLPAGVRSVGSVSEPPNSRAQGCFTPGDLERGRHGGPTSLQGLGASEGAIEGAGSAHCSCQRWPGGLQASPGLGLPSWPVCLPVAYSGPEQCVTGGDFLLQCSVGPGTPVLWQQTEFSLSVCLPVSLSFSSSTSTPLRGPRRTGILHIPRRWPGEPLVP